MISLSPLWISLSVATTATGIASGAGILAALAVANYRGKWRSLLDSFALTPLVLPPSVVGFVLLLLVGRGGPLGRVLDRWDVSIAFSWYAAVLAASIVAFPLMYRTALAAFERIETELLQVARTLGASEDRVFWRIVLPLARSGLIAGTTLAFARALGEFGATLVVAGNIPGRTQTLPMAIFLAVETGDYQQATLDSLAVIALSFGGIALSQSFEKSRERPFRREDIQEFEPPKVRPLAPPTSAMASEPCELNIDIHKQISSDFVLEVALSTRAKSIGILGASGAGKSSLLRCLAGLETPHTGRIQWGGRTFFESRTSVNIPSRDRRVGMVFQNYALFPHLSVADNIGFAQNLSSASQEVTSQLRAVDLFGVADRWPHQLSGGQQQRVALARALASQPDILLLDEPFSALDAHLRDRLAQQTMARLRSFPGTTLLVTHALDETFQYCDELLLMEQGRAIAFGDKRTVFEQPPSLTAARLTGCENISRAIARSATDIEAIDWGCWLQPSAPVPPSIRYVGIRSDYLSLSTYAADDRGLACWIANALELPSTIKVFLKLQHPPSSQADYHLQLKISLELWQRLHRSPLPWSIRFEPKHLLVWEK